MAPLLAEPVDHQQAVVDAQADAEHVDDVDREDRHVTERGGADEHGEGRDDPAERDEQRHAAGDEPAEQDAPWRRWRWAGRSPRPRRRSFSDAVAKVSLTSTLPPTRTSGASSSWARSSTLLGDGELGVLVEVAGEGDHDERGPPVGRPQGVGAGRPGIGDVEHAVERGDRREAGGESLLDLRVVDVDAVGDDGDLAAGLGEVVELLGDPARLGGGAGAEVGRQHRERRAADGGGHDQRARTHARMTARRRRTTKRPSRPITPPPDRRAVPTPRHDARSGALAHGVQDAGDAR